MLDFVSGDRDSDPTTIRQKLGPWGKRPQPIQEKEKERVGHPTRLHSAEPVQQRCESSSAAPIPASSRISRHFRGRLSGECLKTSLSIRSCQVDRTEPQHRTEPAHRECGHGMLGGWRAMATQVVLVASFCSLHLEGTTVGTLGGPFVEHNAGAGALCIAIMFGRMHTCTGSIVSVIVYILLCVC